ncbi:DNA transposase [Frankliniella fusca]|uniref:DNA transposase n=1 Tax=Frankliniella fusca TaxID=407009 RepID=A0AAE1LL52_9NEOP|nr:DNA transposase [Frankliniella fusca]
MPEVKNKKDVEAILSKVHHLKPCKGVHDEDAKDQEWSDKCFGYVPFSSNRCVPCQILHKAISKRLNRSKGNKMFEMKMKIKNQAQRILRLKEEVEKSMKQMSTIREEKVEETLKLLPPEQQSLVKARFDASKHYSKKGRRYATDWIYECMLMRIKAPALYEKLRRENKIALPSKRTQQRYMQNLRPAYGFQENVFKMLEEKASSMPEAERHGCIAIDEMALESRTSFDKNSCQVHGIVNLGGLESEADKEKRGDHALRHRWVQAVGAFLSAGAVKGVTLHKLILEAVGLLEKSGFYVDCITTDGATWNLEPYHVGPVWC